MNVQGFYPVIMSEVMEESKDFYTRLFGFEVVFEADWYISLKRNARPDKAYELAVLSWNHETIPSAFQRKVQGMILNFEVDDVDAEYERLIKQEGLPLHLDIRDEAFGQRHFITSDPSGVLIDMIQIIPPSEDFADNYKEDVWTDSESNAVQ
ncbi:VOC family protein [Paenibacillus ihbetae]|uniref:Glyoxalase/bleomycin resistance/extradiol dioxygenase family protein n=1 Tax=Paenibacillus ihbetae TaxID=1870820 RepID=A0ABX3JTE0_9BACL|nr:VOC family protein [Paenibacillus ihbetae]OOC60952.1 glyoxalase/bleomycin resistance/extradiol dioxygenase family protein [Paenibacillus ihbetae]